jgi:hypothetical protein
MDATPAYDEFSGAEPVIPTEAVRASSAPQRGDDDPFRILVRHLARQAAREMFAASLQDIFPSDTGD